MVQIYSKLSDQLWDDLVTIKSKPPKSRARRRWTRSVKSIFKKVDKFVDKTLEEYRKRGFQPQSVEAAYAAKAHFRQLEAEFENTLRSILVCRLVRMLSSLRSCKSASKRSLSGRTTLRKSISISSSISTLIGR